MAPPHETPNGSLAPSLRWPPPGLERMQGDAWGTAVRGGMAGLILVLPLLLLVAREYGIASLGPLGTAWWIVLVPVTMGLVLALGTLTSVARMLRRAAAAVGRGYGLFTVVFVLTDRRRDMGFLLQGMRYFSVIDAEQRASIARMRVGASALQLMAALWVNVSFSATIVMGAMGWITPRGMWLLTLGPTVLAILSGASLSFIEGRRVAQARKVWYGKPWVEDLASHDVVAWLAGAWEIPEFAASGTGEAETRGRLRSVAALAIAVAVFVALPIMTLIPGSAVGPVFATVALPDVTPVALQAAEVEAYRSYRLEPDPALSAEEAGRLLHDLSLVVGASWGDAEELTPSSAAYDPWMPEGSADSLPVPPQRFTLDLFPWVVYGLDDGGSRALRRIASHPGHEAFARLAQAGEADLTGTRWSLPFAPDAWLLSLSTPVVGIRAAGEAHIGRAAAQLAEGRTDDAERSVREVISVGFLLMEEGPTLIDAIMGMTLAQLGGEGLLSLYEATGRGDAAARLRALVDVAGRGARLIAHAAPPDVASTIQSLPDVVLDPEVLLARRWEALSLVTVLTPCSNLNRAVFGPTEAYGDFLEQAHEALVKRPSDEDYFGLVLRGVVEPGANRWLNRALSMAMRGGTGSCANMVQDVALF